MKGKDMENMVKIKELLKGIGASDELAVALCEELERYSAALKTKYEHEYSQKIGRAKQVCVEEVNKEKAAMARRVKTFMESKVASMEQAYAGRRAIEESESASRLKKAKAILEGVEIKDGGVTNQTLEERDKKIARLEKAINSLKEERNLAVAKANTANDIAAKALQRNRSLESRVATEGYCADHKLPFPKSGKCAKCGGGDKKDDKKEDKKVDEARKPAPTRLDESRTAPAATQSTRRTMNESQSRTGQLPVTEIGKIADTIQD
jgi:uncharacterized protein YdiU (UPF0061 family)